ncbi:aminodeoxychorismate lyase [Bacteroidia bacterium]|nr:aminodeoxychorismate lyase [Bacteroidia bacterium]
MLIGILYYKVNTPFFNINEPVYIYIDGKKDYNHLLSDLESAAKIKNRTLFDRLASKMNYPENVKSGKYRIAPATTCLEAVRMFRNAQQVPVKITFNNIRLKKDFAERLGEQLMFGPERLLDELNSPSVCNSLGFDTINIVTMFIPNTYEMYWTISADNFLQKMKKEYDKFWTPERLKKAKELSLSPHEVSVLASIVEEETADKSEYPIVAGLYINRLRKGMLLQADPTVKFAVGDVTLRRILFAHLEVDSPYNTYKHSGLPPGPIRIPSISGIDAVLNYAQHNYLYMVAKEDFSGKHNFATNLSEHNRNARKYQDALNRNNIR